jgi:PIN domain
MTVYVESNFVLEQSLEQEQAGSCSRIIELAAERRIALVIPAFSLAEPHGVISQKAKARSRLSSELRPHLNELGRSKQHRDVPASFDALASVLAGSAQLELKGLQRTVLRLLKIVEVIPLDSGILRTATKLQFQYDLSGQDSIVLASVLAHLSLHQAHESCFLNRNHKDFDDPDIRERLNAFACEFFANFDQGLKYISSKLESQSP